MATTYERLKKIVVEQLGADEDEVKPEASFVDDLNADSLDLVELIMSLEEEFGTEISDEDAEKIRTVQDAVDYIDERVLLAPRRRRTHLVTVRPGEAFAARIGLPVRDLDLLEQALVHSSWHHEHRDAAVGHNERLEFLGDSVVNLAISEALYVRHPDDDEGYLSARRAAIVSTTGSPGWPDGSTSVRRSCSARGRPSAAAGGGHRCWPRPSRPSPAPCISISGSSPSGTG